MKKPTMIIGLVLILFVAGSMLPSDSNAFFGISGRAGGTTCFSGGYYGAGCGWTGSYGCGYPGTWGYGWGKGWVKAKKMKAKGKSKAQGTK